MTETVQYRRPISNMRRRVAGAALLLTIMLMPGLVAAQRASAKAFKILYGFADGKDGALPVGGVIRDKAGNFYGATVIGGGSSTCSNGCGTVYKLDTTGHETVLHRFTGTGRDGVYPAAGLIRDEAGNLYGVTGSGGNFSACSTGCGIVYKLDKAGHETVLYTFTGTGGDGAGPSSTLIRDEAGNLYGTTSGGGNSSACSTGCGTVYKLDKTGHETVLYRFTGTGGDGAHPLAQFLLRDAEGNLYGTTWEGGTSNAGTVYKLDTTDHETVLHNFTGTAGDGSSPEAGVIQDKAGNLYGTTISGGGGNCGCGIVYKLDTTGHETVLYRFTGTGGDGANPVAELVRDEAGNLYGTTYSGGALGYGTVFKLNKVGSKEKETVVYSFLGNFERKHSAENPDSRLILDPAGNLYGVSQNGGDHSHGTVFKLTP